MVRAGLVAVGHVGREHMAQVGLRHDQQVVEALPPRLVCRLEGLGDKVTSEPTAACSRPFSDRLDVCPKLWPSVLIRTVE